MVVRAVNYISRIVRLGYYQLMHWPSWYEKEAFKTINELQSSKYRVVDASWSTCLIQYVANKTSVSIPCTFYLGKMAYLDKARFLKLAHEIDTKCSKTITLKRSGNGNPFINIFGEHLQLKAITKSSLHLQWN